MTTIKKAISSIAVASAICGALTIGAFASNTDTSVKASSAINSLNYDFNDVYQEYMAFITDPITRYISSEEFTTTVTIFRGPKYPTEAAVLPYASSGQYSYSTSMSGTGTYSADYYYHSSSSSESREVVLGIGFDSRETPGSRFKIVGTFYPNGL